MRVLKLTAVTSSPAIATVYNNRRNKELYFNIKHGSQGTELWAYSCELSKDFFAPETPSAELKLDQDNYVLIPVKKNGDLVKDKKGNALYMLTVDHNHNHRRDLLLFWEIPNVNYTDVGYSISGMANEIGKGWSGKDRGEYIFKSPAPVLEVYGDAVLEWHAQNKAGDTFKQTINIVNGNVEVKPVITTLAPIKKEVINATEQPKQ